MNCGHNLRGLRRDGRCGECGQPVVVSLVSSETGDAPWLAKLCRGVGTLGLLLPWLWLPLAWPLVFLGGWWATAPNPAEGPRARRSARIWRGALALILASGVALAACEVPAATIPGLLLWQVFLLGRLARVCNRPGLKRQMWVILLLWPSAVVALASANSAQSSVAGIEGVVLALFAGLALAGTGLLLFVILFVRIWAELDRRAAIAAAHRRRVERRHAVNAAAEAARLPGEPAVAPPAPP